MKRAREGGTGEGHSQGQYRGVQQSVSPADKNTSFKGGLPGAGRSRERRISSQPLLGSSGRCCFFSASLVSSDAFSALLLLLGKMQQRYACPAAPSSYSSV